MAIGAAAVGGIDRIDIAVKDAGAPIDFFRIGGVRRVKLGGDGKRTGAQYALQTSRRHMTGQDRQRIARHRFIFENHDFPPAFSRATLSHEDWPCRRRSTANCTTWIAALPSRMRLLPATA